MRNGADFVSRKRPLLNSGTTGYEPKPLKQGPSLGNGTDKGIRKSRTSRKARFCRWRRTSLEIIGQEMVPYAGGRRPPRRMVEVVKPLELTAMPLKPGQGEEELEEPPRRWPNGPEGEPEAMKPLFTPEQLREFNKWDEKAPLLRGPRMDQPRPAHLPVGWWPTSTEVPTHGESGAGGPDDEDDGGVSGYEDDTIGAGSGSGLPHADDAGADDAESEASA